MIWLEDIVWVAPLPLGQPYFELDLATDAIAS